LRDKFHRTDEELLADELYISACTKRVQPTETLTVVPKDPDDNPSRRQSWPEPLVRSPGTFDLAELVEIRIAKSTLLAFATLTP
jgi:hypothetical protein